MSKIAKCVLVAAFIAAVFLCGYLTARWQLAEREVEAGNQSQVATQSVNNQRAEALDTNLLRQRDAETSYHEGVSNDTAKTDELLHRVLRVTDGMREQESTSSTDKDITATNLRRAEAREARLRGALRLALEAGGAEAKRANGVARELNLCISQLESDRLQLRQAQE